MEEKKKKMISRQELVEKRKQWQAQREMEKDLIRDLDAANKEEEFREGLHAGKNPYVIGAINFISTLFMGEVLTRLVLFIFYFAIGLPTGPVGFVLRVLVLIAAIVSVFQKRAVLEGVFVKVLETLQIILGRR